MTVLSRFGAAGVSLALVMTAWVGVGAPAQAAGPSRQPDVASAGGYDFHTLRDADVVATTARNNVVVRYTAGRALSNGVLRILVPAKSWPTKLHPVDGLYEGAAPGAFSVRPGIARPEGDLPEPTRPADSMCSPVRSGKWSVARVPGGQLITVRGVTCGAGRELAIRLEGLQAPSRPGTYALPMLMTSTGAVPRVSVARVKVVQPPRTRLVVSLPPIVASGNPFIVTVSALKPNGRPDLNYRGAVAIADPDDCTLIPPGQQVAGQFTAGDGGTLRLLVKLDKLGPHQLRVYDIARRAIDGLSPEFEVGGPPPESIICPVSYH